MKLRAKSYGEIEKQWQVKLVALFWMIVGLLGTAHFSRRAVKGVEFGRWGMAFCLLLSVLLALGAYALWRGRVWGKVSLLIAIPIISLQTFSGLLFFFVKWHLGAALVAAIFLAMCGYSIWVCVRAQRARN